MMRQFFHNIFYSADFLPDGNIETAHVAASLIDDGINRKGRFAGLSITDDKFTLALADGHHGIDGKPAGLQRTFYGITIDDGGRFMLTGRNLRL